LKDWDPNDPKGEKKAAAPAEGGAPKPKKIVKKEPDFDELLSAGLKKK
jgi:hypothetical protein